MPTRIATLLFHDVADNVAESGFQRRAALPYKHSIASFSEYLDSIGESQLTPERVIDLDLERSEKHLMLTFDDGGRSALRIGDMLNQRGWKGHFFIVTGLIGTPTFLDAGGIRHLHSCGHMIGSHSHAHPDIFKTLTRRAMIEEWRVSCDRLSDLLGEKCELASVPGGDTSSLVFESADAAGLRYLFTSEPWLTPRRSGNCQVFGRVCPKSSTSTEVVRQLAQFRGWRRELALRKAKAVARTALFPLYTAYVRWNTSR